MWRNGRLVQVHEVTLTPQTTDGTGVARMAVYGIDRLLLFPEGTG